MRTAVEETNEHYLATIKKGLKKIQARMGFAPMTFAILMHNCEDSFHIRLSKFVI